MSNRKWFLAAALTGCAGCVTLLFSQQADSPKSEEYLLLGSPNRGAGEPIIFVNPKAPNNIIVVAMATLNRLPSGETPIPRGQPGATELRVKELSTPDGSRTDIAVTHDGGKTWTFSEDNLRKVLEKNRCSDSFAGAGPDGTLYMGCLAYLNRGSADYEDGYAPNGEARIYHGGSAIEWSTDHGRTWSRPVWVHPALSPSLYAPTVKPVFEQASPWDRPIFVADAQTGTIYVSGSGLAYTVDPATVERPKIDPGKPGKGYTGYPPRSVARQRTFLRASHDRARTWGVIYPMDSDEYPGTFGGGFTAAYGNLAVAYTASKVPDSLSAQCPCTVFGTSRDDGKTFEYRVVPPLPATAAPAASSSRGFGGVMVSADPTAEGRYAIARQNGRRIMISVTDDGGRTWREPVTAAELPPGARFGHRAMRYSPKGVLALMWKQVYENGSFDVWSSASLDGARTFRTLRVSHAVSPNYIRERGNFLFGDDLSSLDVDAEYVHFVWGDNRSGFEGTWYGRIPLGAYAPLAAGTQGTPRRGMPTPVTALRSPEVNPDRTVTLRFSAPEATDVQLVGEINLGGAPKRMTKGPDGVWTITVGPLPPEIWSYNFRVQGVMVTDPSNPAVKPTPPGEPMSSFVEVPGDSPAFYDSRPVPHGEVRMVLYESKAMGVTRWLWIYTPPNYDRSMAKYPVLYLLHGNGEAQNGWVMNGRANIILDNLIADRKAEPMIVVMPQGHALQGAGVGPLVRIEGETGMFSPRFANDLLEDVIPLVERTYRVVADADHRAIAGLSMGGGQALMIGLAHPDLFHYVLGYSAAVGGPFNDIQESFEEPLANPSKVNANLRLLWVSVGRQDFLYRANQDFIKVLNEKGIKNTFRETEGAHVWSVWRNNLNETAPMLFRGR
jgi:enterochelin esterase family protein